MTSLPKTLRLPYRLDPEPVNGWVLAHCEPLDLVTQGRTAEEARAQLADEAGLLLGQAQAAGTLAALVARVATAGGGASSAGGGAPPATGDAAPAAALDLDLSRLP